MNMINKFFVTLFFSGLFPKAPGTVGSFVALVLGYLIVEYSSVNVLVGGTIFIFIVGVYGINAYQKNINKEDPKEVVIDELVGMWIALSVVPHGLLESVLAFLMFRFFDIVKPSIIGRVDKSIKNGLGVMLDDVLAGIFGGIGVLLILKGLNFLGVY